MPTSFAHIELSKQFVDPIMARQSTASARRVNPYDTDEPTETRIRKGDRDAGRREAEALSLPSRQRGD
jgi:hypothetical protein